METRMVVELTKREISYLIDCMLDSDYYARAYEKPQNLDRQLFSKFVSKLIIEEKK